MLALELWVDSVTKFPLHFAFYPYPHIKLGDHYPGLAPG